MEKQKTPQPDRDTTNRGVPHRGPSPDDARAQPAPAPPHVSRAWVRRLRKDAQRPLSENLAEGIALSHVLVRYAQDTPRR